MATATAVIPSPLSGTFSMVPDSIPHIWDALVIYTGGIPPYTATWNWGDGNSTGGLYPSHTYTTAGTYSICLTVTDANNCTSAYCQNDSVYRLASSSMVQVNVINASTGINAVSRNVEMKMYPNPVCAELIIDGLIGGASVSLYNSLGEQVLVQNSFGSSIKINVASLREGIYFVSVRNSSGVFTQKILIQD
jgi:hypothetical protein